jgi:uncharacterized membrane protein
MAYTDGPQAGRKPTLRFKVIGEAWQMLSTNMSPWILASLVAILLMSIIIVPAMVRVFIEVAAEISKGQTSVPSPDFGSRLVTVTINVVVQIIQFVLLGGMVKMALRQLRGQTISVGDLFSGFAHLGPLILAGLIYGLVMELGNLLDGSAGPVFFLCLIPAMLLSGLWMLTIPLIVDQNLDAITALGASTKMLRSSMWMAILFYMVLGIVSGLGILVCGIGIIVTYSLLPIGTALVYRDFFPERFSQESDNPVSPRLTEV